MSSSNQLENLAHQTFSGIDRIHSGTRCVGGNVAKKPVCRSRSVAGSSPVTAPWLDRGPETLRGVGGTVDSEAALRYAGSPLSRVRAHHLRLCLTKGPESLRSPCCGVAMYKNQLD
ncbi:hypothetical protein PoB_004925900 [Plakobranchus ocellatus]|uniref:Uncharacterized protein n=1 Tax=Plakobranchus ocellatus TaxID=259542 RepID=A0AAV4BWH5_9GAST|nr:hypothetical protein PoB_004925900 [Plakobranchus ocellatus]